MRILHVLGKLDRGGVETWLVQLLEHIDRSRYQMDFMVHTTEPGAYDERVKALGARIIPCLDPAHPVKYAANFRRILKTYGPYDCVHSHVHHYSGYVLALAAAMRVPLRLAHSHNDTSAIEGGGSLKRKLYCFATRKMLAAFAHGGLAVSKEAGNSLFPRNWQRSERWELCHLGIDLSRFSNGGRNPELRRELGIPEGAVVVGHVGRFAPQKNHEFLVDIAAEFLKLESRAHFLLVGDGPLRPEIAERITRAQLQDRFHLIGLRDDVPQLMCGAMDLFLFPSRWEGLPLTLLETQAAGLPALVSDAITAECDSVPELVAQESLSSSARGWAHRLVLLAQTRRLSPRDTAPALSYWSVEHSAERMATFYGRHGAMFGVSQVSAC